MGNRDERICLDVKDMRISTKLYILHTCVNRIGCHFLQQFERENADFLLHRKSIGAKYKGLRPKAEHWRNNGMYKHVRLGLPST